MALIPQFGGLIWTLLAFVIALSVIVAIHEYGHYIVGRWSGIHADVFSLGFGPVIYSRFDKRGTKWQIAALPFGGYVKFKGDANASGGADLDSLAHMSEAERRRTMNGAPLWARAATVAARAHSGAPCMVARNRFGSASAASIAATSLPEAASASPANFT